MPITAAVLYDLVHCPQRVALDAFGDVNGRDPVNPFVKLLWERGTAFERETIAKVRQPFLDLSVMPSDEKERQTLEAMRRGESLIYAGRIGVEDLLGEPDLLRKHGNGYVPGDIKSGAGEEGASEESDGKPKVHYAVQLALYVDILERLGLSAGRHAFVWDIHGEEVPYDFTAARGSKTTETLWDKYQESLAEARAVLARRVTPQAAHGGVCKLCHWYSFCIDQLAGAGDLTLIPFLGRPIRDTMQGAIPNLAAFAASDPEDFIQTKKTVFAGLGPDRLRTFHVRARLLAQPGAKPFLKTAVQLPVSPTELFFDIEVDAMRDVVYLHGVVERQNGDNETERVIQFFSEEVMPNAEREAFANAIAYFKGQKGATIYYYSKYERTHYRRLQAKYPDVCTAEDIEAIFDPACAVDLYNDVVTKATEWPTYDHSIKTLAKHLGFEWRDTHPSGAVSVEWFHRWTKERDPAVRQRILEYNEDDCRATRVLLDGIRALPASAICR